MKLNMASLKVRIGAMANPRLPEIGGWWWLVVGGGSFFLADSQETHRFPGKLRWKP